jgi:hypothetical protein
MVIDMSVQPSTRPAVPGTHFEQPAFFQGYAVPSSEANPANMSPTELAEYGLPPRPDKDSEPSLHDLWLRTFGHEFRFVKFSAEPHRLTHLDVRPAPSAAFVSRYEGSLNWSGAYVQPSNARTFVQVWGQWEAPALRLPRDAIPDGDYRCSIWIGLDGRRLYRNSSLPQIGTMQVLRTPHTDCCAWVQWWVRGNTGNRPTEISCFPVDTGDVISCVLTVLDEHHVKLNIVNQTKKIITAVKASAPTDSSNTRLSISGATAEWVLERPAIVDEPTLYQFPDYGSMDFVNCRAVEALAGGVSPAERFLASPRFMRMHEVREAPQRTRLISMAKPIDETSFNVTYGDFRR